MWSKKDESHSNIFNTYQLAFRAKYPLAATDFLLCIYGHDQALGFDVGCSYDATVKNSPLLGPDAKVKGLQIIDNAFHGWVHNQLCQLKYHPVYHTSIGLEDLETLKCFFSSSNTIACMIWHVMRFHWHQAVDLHFWQWNEEKYQDLSMCYILLFVCCIILTSLPSSMQLFLEQLQTGPGNHQGLYIWTLCLQGVPWNWWLAARREEVLGELEGGAGGVCLGLCICWSTWNPMQGRVSAWFLL